MGGRTEYGMFPSDMMSEPPPTPQFTPKSVSGGVELTGLEEGRAYSLDSAVNNDTPTYTHMIIAELIGTYILVFAGCGSIVINTTYNISVVGVAVVWGMVLMCMVYSLGHVSGAHFNPSVTIAFAVSRKFPWKHVPMYIGSQLMGAILASLTLQALYHKHGDLDHIVTKYSDPTTDLEAVVWEFLLTFFLMFAICGVATDHRAVNELSGVAVGATLLFDIIIAGPITGASMNPARSIGPALALSNYKNLWVYVVGPTLGTIVATMVYNLIRVPAIWRNDSRSFD